MKLILMCKFILLYFTFIYLFNYMFNLNLIFAHDDTCPQNVRIKYIINLKYGNTFPHFLSSVCIYSFFVYPLQFFFITFIYIFISFFLLFLFLFFILVFMFIFTCPSKIFFSLTSTVKEPNDYH